MEGQAGACREITAFEMMDYFHEKGGYLIGTYVSPGDIPSPRERMAVVRLLTVGR